uniref:Uncharacterized protein n=1 Tax=Onchocerca volvulus TaxID=6282 RepID=A0A8R1Y2A0_ONCVO
MRLMQKYETNSQSYYTFSSFPQLITLQSSYVHQLNKPKISCNNGIHIKVKSTNIILLLCYVILLDKLSIDKLINERNNVLCTFLAHSSDMHSHHVIVTHDL